MNFQPKIFLIQRRKREKGHIISPCSSVLKPYFDLPRSKTQSLSQSQLLFLRETKRKRKDSIFKQNLLIKKEPFSFLVDLIKKEKFKDTYGVESIVFFEAFFKNGRLVFGKSEFFS